MVGEEVDPQIDNIFPSFQWLVSDALQKMEWAMPEVVMFYSFQ